TGCLTLPQAGRSFDRQIFLLVGSSIAAATALEATGGAQLIADGTVALLRGQSATVILSGYFAVVAIMTNFLSNNATAVLFTPIATGIAKAIGAPAEAFVTATIFAANCSFATPIGYQTNLMVMGPGHYSFADFIKAGIPLVAIIRLTFSIVGPWYYGLCIRDSPLHDAASDPVAAILPHRTLAMPVSRGTAGTEGVHASGRGQGAGAERSSDSRWLSPLAEHRLPSGVRDMP